MGRSEEQADLPLAHAQALLAVSQGQVEYVRTRLSIGSHEIQALHFVRPGPLDLVAVAVPPEDEQNLPPLPWFGPEVSTEPAYQRRRLALDGAPDAPEMDVTNAALNSLLDLLEDRFTTWPLPGQAEERTHRQLMPLHPRGSCPRAGTEADEESMISALRMRSFASWRGLCNRGEADNRGTSVRVAGTASSCHGRSFAP